MKIGDRLSVQIEGFDVAEAVIEDIEDGNATIVIPSTRIVVAVKQSLDIGRVPERSGPDHIFGGIEDNRPTTSEAQEQVNFTAVPDQTQPPRGNLQAEGSIGDGIHNQELDSSALD